MGAQVVRSSRRHGYQAGTAPCHIADHKCMDAHEGRAPRVAEGRSALPAPASPPGARVPPSGGPPSCPVIVLRPDPNAVALRSTTLGTAPVTTSDRKSTRLNSSHL